MDIVESTIICPECVLEVDLLLPSEVRSYYVSSGQCEQCFRWFIKRMKATVAYKPEIISHKIEENEDPASRR
jgi:hypothetical protein